jgi:hypothetical protein
VSNLPTDPRPNGSRLPPCLRVFHEKALSVKEKSSPMFEDGYLRFHLAAHQREAAGRGFAFAPFPLSQ